MDGFDVASIIRRRRQRGVLSVIQTVSDSSSGTASSSNTDQNLNIIYTSNDTTTAVTHIKR